MSINIFSPTWEIQDSYGRIANELAAYASATMHVNPFGFAAPKKVIVPAFGGILLGYPTIYPTYPEIANIGKRVAVTMFESDCIPDAWTWVLDSVDEIVVPSSWLVKVFRKAGVKKPIHVVPLGVSDVFKNVHRESQTDRPFTVMAIADRGERKAWHKAAFAFYRAFGDDERYQLILKCRDGAIAEEFTGLSNPNIRFLQADYSDEEMAALYASVDVMLFLSSGEGFGLPPREFAASGGIALVTDWSGLHDDADQWAFPLPYTLVPAWQHDDKNYNLGMWADVDLDAASRLLTEIAGWDSAYRLSMGAQFAQRARRYDWKEFAQHVIDIWSA